MNRIPFVLVQLLQRLCGRSAAQRRFLMMNLAELDPLPLGPGWFDSSWELETGLEVSETAATDAQLAPWFDTALRTQEAARCRAVSDAPASPNAPQAPCDANLIEFDLGDVGMWQLPAPAMRAPKPRHAELELALV
jgi:hypothetical protein